MTPELQLASPPSMTVAEVLRRLCGVGYVTYGGASLFHDEFGHIISSILLTRWPEDPRFSAPVVFSTDSIIPEQLAELCQRMIVRASPRCVADGIANNQIHVAGTLDEPTMQRIETGLFEGLPSPPTINWPDARGHKLSKLEALAWTHLFAVEDIHIFAERYAIQQKDHPLDPERVAEFREHVAELMYAYALRPDLCGAEEQVHARQDIIRDCFDTLGIERDPDTEFIFGNHMSDALLGRFYDTFLPHFDALDSKWTQRTGRGFSQLEVEELHALDAREFLPPTRPPFDWIFDGEPIPDKDDTWLGILRYDEPRSLWLIADVIPPQRVIA